MQYDIEYRCEWSVMLHVWYLRHFPQYLLQMEAKQVSLHILGRVVASLVQAAESKSSQPKEPTTQNTKPVLLWTSKHKHIGVSQYLLFQTFQHNLSFINRQVQATLVFENKSYPKHFFLNSCKFEDRNLIYLHLILNSITQPCPMYYIHVIDNPFFTQKSIETHFE